MNKYLHVLIGCLMFIQTMQGQSAWSRKADFPDQRDRAVAFSLDGFGYAGTGSNNISLQNDFWKYDPNNDSWEEIDSMPTLGRRDAFCFVINDKAYVGGGVNEHGVFDDEFWEYDPQLGQWTRKSDVPMNFDQTCFSIKNKGYLLSTLYPRNFYEYDPETDIWTNKDNFPGRSSIGQVGFSIDAKGYIGTGSLDGSEFWEYDPIRDQWSNKIDFPGTPRHGAVGFNIGNFGYIGLGIAPGTLLNDFWEYNPLSDSWKQIDSCGFASVDAVAFSIGKKGYVGTGIFSSGHDFWEYTPNITTVHSIDQSHCVNIYPNPVADILIVDSDGLEIETLTIYNTCGEIVHNVRNTNNTISISGLPIGLYILQIHTATKTVVEKFIKE